MSLIFTSNTQDEYRAEDLADSTKTYRANIGIENPADYHNHLTSPLEVKTNSQIAVQSVKLTRKGQWDFESATNLLYYFGRPLGDALSLEDVTSRPHLVQVPRGSYTNKEFASQLETQMKRTKVSPAVHNNFSVNTSLVGGDFKGFEISCSQNGSTYVADMFEELDSSIADVVVASTNPTRPVSNNFTLEQGIFARTNASGTLTDGLCCGIGTDFPLSMGTTSSFIVDFQSASYDATIGVNVNSSWAVGLTRPTVQLKNTGEDIGIAPQGFKSVGQVLPHFFDYVAVFDAENGSRGSPSTFVAVGKDKDGVFINSAGQTEAQFNTAQALLVDTGSLKLYQGSYQTDIATGKPLASSYKLHEILYYGGTNQLSSIITNPSILGGGATYKAIEFNVEGDEVRVNIIKYDNSKVSLIDSANNDHQARSFKPTTDFTTALYPKFIQSLMNNKGLEVTSYSTYSNASTAYKYPTHTGYNATDMSGGLYTVGDSSYSNEVSWSSQMRHAGSIEGDTSVANQAPSWYRQDGVNSFIKPPDTTYKQMLPKVASPSNTIIYQGVGSVTGGVNYQHLLVLEDTTPASGGTKGDYYSSMCNIGSFIGFPDLRVLDQSQGTLSLSDKQVTWFSSDLPTFSVNSAFVRVTNLNYRCYNSTKNSVSKMLYHIPRFTNDGRQFGDLFFEVGDRTYVDLNNTSPFMLNQLQVSICDKNERIAQDLTSDTIVVFHIRQKESYGQFS